MSLINDAIKQANKANKERATAGASPAAAPTTGMHAAEVRGNRPSSGSLTSMILVAGIVVFVLLGGAFLFLSMRESGALNEPQPGQGAPSAIAPTTAEANAATAPTANPQSSAPTSNISSSNNPVADALTNPLPPAFHPAPTAAPPNSTAPANATTTAPARPNDPTATTQPAGPRPFPELKLQGIYYRLNNPSVMINGQTLEIGDIVGNARVTRIERKEVTLELDGRTKVLRLQ